MNTTEPLNRHRRCSVFGFLLTETADIRLDPRAGPVLQLDTASDDRLGQGTWTVGPTH